MKNIVIIDWDDTLFPTSNPPKSTKSYKLLDNTLHSLLTTILSYAKVYIVTNATTKWISISSSSIPKTRKLIKTSIPVISGRDRYKKQNINLWKKIIFNNIIKSNNSSNLNIVSIGDADYEYQALIYSYRTFHNNYYKHIRFMKYSFNVLIEQLVILKRNIPSIINHHGHMDTMFVMG